MTTTAFPPPPATPSPPTPPPGTPPAPARPNTALRGVLLLIGSALLIGLLVVTGLRIAMLITSEDDGGLYRVTEPVQSLSVRTTGTDVQVHYADVQHPEFELEDNRQDLRMRHQVRNGELAIVIERPWRSIGNLTPSFSRDGTSVLQVRLPRDLAGADLELRTTAGEVSADGDFGAVDINTSAAEVHLSGGAESLQVDASANDIVARDFATSGAVRVNITAGSLRYDAAELPAAIDVQGAAADVAFSLPAGEYEIRTNNVISDLTQNVSSTAGAERVYEFNVTAGSVSLTERP